MKKSKLSITLVTSFIAAMALSACSDVTSSKTAIVTFTPYGSKESIDLITNDVYKEYSKTSAGVSKFYDKILEVLIRYEFKEKNFDKGDMKYSEIETWAKNQVEEQKKKAKSNAESNGTKYDDEWDSILESNNVETEKEFREKFIYEKEKEVITNWYADNTDNAEALKNEFIGLDSTGALVNDQEGDVKSAFPYHIRHILVKVEEASETSEKFYKGTISEAQAKSLYNIVTTLAQGADETGAKTFAQVASQYSEDGSGKSGGDVGIMTNAATSGSLGMVNEFQLGLYAYDNLYDPDRKGDAVVATIKDELGFDSIVDEKTNKTAEEALPASFVEVPYEAFLKIGEYADVTADKYGNKLANGSATVYPRNILWNKYLNMHNVFVIKKAKVGASSFNDGTNPNAEFSALCGATYTDEEAAALKLTRFNANKYLTDERGNVIIGVRSEYGIHFMIIEKSMHEYQTLSDYYTTKLPTEPGYPKNEDGSLKDTYVGYIESLSTEDYKTRADDVKSKITSFDSTYDYRLFQWLNEQVTITYSENAKGLDKKIEAYIGNQRESNSNKQEEGLTKVWKTYTRMLARQNEDRNVFHWKTTNPATGTQSPELTRLASEAIANDFYTLYTLKKADGITDYNLEDATDAAAVKALYEKFAEGGDYYYYA